MRGIRRDRWDGCLVAIKTLGVKLFLVEPERQLETTPELGRLACQPFRHGRLPQPREDTAQSDLRLVDVSLYLDQCNRQLRRATVRVEERVGGILPTLIAH